MNIIFLWYYRAFVVDFRYFLSSFSEIFYQSFLCERTQKLWSVGNRGAVCSLAI